MGNTIKIKDIEYPIYETELHHSKLKFYKDNPRIYSVINTDGYDATQQEIEEKTIGILLKVVCSGEKFF